MWAIINDPSKIINKLGYTPIFYSFNDIYEEFKRKAKKPGLATEEYFSLDYNSTLEDLRTYYWINIPNISKIKDLVIEYNE